jgi:hypothetical protein
LYDPVGAEPAREWIELYYFGTTPLDLSQYKVGDEETVGSGEGMYRFPDGAQAAPGKIIVIANQATTFRDLYGYLPDYELSETLAEVPNMVKYSAWATGTIALSNSGDDVLLLGPLDQVWDALSWYDSSWAFSPPAPDIAEGHSLERRPATQDSNSAADWVDQPSPQPGLVDAGK